MRFLPLFFCLLPAVAWAQQVAPPAPPVAPTAPRVWDFSDAKAPAFASPYAAPGGVAARVDIQNQNGALQFVNRAGGSFGVKLAITPFDAQQYPTLSFDYTRSSDTKINLFFKVNGGFYGVIFSGPPRVRIGSYLLGTLPNVGNKGHVVIPLRDWLSRFQPKAQKLQVEEVLAGNWDNDGYLLAGIGGNGPGATWSLDNFTLSPPEATVATAPRAGTPFIQGNDIIWPLEVEGGLDTRSAALKLNENSFDFASPLLRYETAFDAKNQVSRRIVLKAGDAGLTFKDGQSLNLALTAAQDMGGHALTNTSATLPFHSSANQGGPTLPQLKFENAAAPSCDFESDRDGWQGINAVVDLDAVKPFSGVNSLRFYNPRTASPFDAKLAVNALDIAQFPVITFAYRADDRLRVDFRLTWDDKPYSIRFFDHDGAQPRLGTLDNLAADGKWHQAQIPLLEWMKKARPDATSFKISYFGVSDDAWMGNARGVTWWLDDFRFAPRVADAIHAQVSLRDISGVGDVSWQLDQQSDTVPDRTPEGGPKLDIPLTGRAPGLWWLHVRAQNGAGGWSDTAHFSVVVG